MTEFSAMRIMKKGSVVFEELGVNRRKAYQLCTQTARVRLGNLWAVAAKFPKYLDATDRS